jgi:hypothetical protein
MDPSVRLLLLSVMRQFPEAGGRMKARARQLRSVEFSTTDMLEEFTRETQRALREGNESLARAHLTFMSAFLRKADAVQREYIDVYYVEGFLPGLPESARPDAWALMPQNLKDLHTQMWGSPSFRRR